MINKNVFRLEPSDFANFVFCGLKWLLEKTNKYSSGSKTAKRRHIRKGIANEDKCIDFISEQLHSTSEQILYVGINKSQALSTPVIIEPLRITMQAKPDLIVNYKNRTRLFEFKALGNPKYLYRKEFDADHAQIWCYTYLTDFQIDDYYLFRYFIDPFYKVHIEGFARSVKTYDNKKLRDELSDTKFLNLFHVYVKMNDALKEMNRNNTKQLIEKLKDFSPKYKTDKRCSSCIHKVFNRCPLHVQI